jgi:hypothetical protein
MTRLARAASGSFSLLISVSALPFGKKLVPGLEEGLSLKVAGSWVCAFKVAWSKRLQECEHEIMVGWFFMAGFSMAFNPRAGGSRCIARRWWIMVVLELL